MWLADTEVTNKGGRVQLPTRGRNAAVNREINPVYERSIVACKKCHYGCHLFGLRSAGDWHSIQNSFHQRFVLCKPIRHLRKGQTWVHSVYPYALTAQLKRKTASEIGKRSLRRIVENFDTSRREVLTQMKR